MSFRKKIFLGILLLQLSIIFYLLFTIYAKYSTALVSITPLDKKMLDISSSGSLQHFFEPKGNKNIKEMYHQRVSLSTAPVYTINKDTLNERFDYEVAKPNDTFRIITLGDSFTYGYFVNTKDNWPERLEDILNSECKNDQKYEVINLSVPNYDIQYSVERFKKRGMKYQPDLLLWFLKHDDFAQINEITLPEKRKLQDEMIKSGEFEKSMKNGEYWPHTEQVIEAFKKNYGTEEILKKQLSFLLSLNKYYTGKLLIVLPHIEHDVNRSLLKSFAQKRENTYLYLDLPEFSRFPDLHPNTKGHLEIAANIYSYQIHQNLLPCKNE